MSASPAHAVTRARPRRPRVQTCRTASAGKCALCGCADRAALQCHRLVPGAAGGRYTWANTVCVCANCHTKIRLLGRRTGTGGTYLHLVVGGEEKFIRE
jgi:hypothetical protein